MNGLLHKPVGLSESVSIRSEDASGRLKQWSPSSGSKLLPPLRVTCSYWNRCFSSAATSTTCHFDMRANPPNLREAPTYTISPIVSFPRCSAIENSHKGCEVFLNRPPSWHRHDPPPHSHQVSHSPLQVLASSSLLLRDIRLALWVGADRTTKCLSFRNTNSCRFAQAKGWSPVAYWNPGHAALPSPNKFSFRTLMLNARHSCAQLFRVLVAPTSIHVRALQRSKILLEFLNWQTL